VELILSGSIGKLITINFNSNTYYNQIDASSLGYSARKSNISWNANLNTNTSLTKTTLLQINSNYNSERLTPQGKRLPTFVVNMGIRQELWKNKAAFILTVSDVFNTLHNNSILDTPLLYEKVIRKRSPRIIYAGLTFNLGKQTKKSKDEQLKFDNQL
jgi:hypothetical protein